MEQEVIKAATGMATTAANKGVGKLTDLLFSKKLREEKRLDDLSSAQTKKDIELIEKGLAEYRDGKFLLMEEQIGNPTSPLGLILKQNHQNQTNNLGKCLNIAYEKLLEKDNETINDEQVSDTFFNKWMNYGKEVSEEELQDLWGSILAKEVSEPNSINYLVLNTLALMSKEHLDTFYQLIPYMASNRLFCDSSKNIYEQLPEIPIHILDQLVDLNIIKGITLSDIYFSEIEYRETNKGTFPCISLNDNYFLILKHNSKKSLEPTFWGVSTIGKKLYEIALSNINIEKYIESLIENISQLPSFKNITEYAIFKHNPNGSANLIKVINMK